MQTVPELQTMPRFTLFSLRSCVVIANSGIPVTEVHWPSVPSLYIRSNRL